MTKDGKECVVVVGGGGREHALVEKLGESRQLDSIICIPGNPGIAKTAKCIPHDLADIPGLTNMIADLRPNLVVVGPEQPLVDGLADELIARGIRVCGPTKAAARIEVSARALGAGYIAFFLYSFLIGLAAVILTALVAKRTPAARS